MQKVALTENPTDMLSCTPLLVLHVSFDLALSPRVKCLSLSVPVGSSTKLQLFCKTEFGVYTTSITDLKNVAAILKEFIEAFLERFFQLHSNPEHVFVSER